MNKVDVTQEEKVFVTKILENAAEKLAIKLDLIRIEFDGIGGCFKTIENAAVTNNVPYLFIKINLDWLRANRETNDITIIRDILYHEMRHVYQFGEIANLQNDQPISESKETVLSWINNKKYYISYYSHDRLSHVAHFSQPIEVDAMAFSVVLRLIDAQNGDDVESGLAIPDEVWPLVEKRISEILVTLMS